MVNETTIEQVAATIAHEVKNPISLVLANVDLLELEDEDSRNSKAFRVIRRELNKVMDIVMDFTELTKPVKAEHDELDINSMVLNVIDSCKDISRDRIAFEFSSSIGNTKVRGDEKKLMRVFYNIYKNAMEAIETKGEIKTCLEINEGGLMVKIEDNGVGLSEEAKQKLSLPFFTTKETGSGLGVFISRNIVEEHKGRFKIDGKEKEGCIVTMWLPV